MNLAMVVAVAGPILRPMINDSQATRTTKGRRRWVRRRNTKVRMNVRYFYGVQPKQTKKCPNGIVISTRKGESAVLPLNATSNHLQWTYHLISPLTKILTNNFGYYHTTLQVTNLKSKIRKFSLLPSARQEQNEIFEVWNFAPIRAVNLFLFWILFFCQEISVVYCWHRGPS